ncbi:MAG TPA: exonuclease domain-containing protein, partial [Ktedonobacterales bacterium]|nr:exonuclease domain-containing protein [Ktedonobacterales bacterium]
MATRVKASNPADARIREGASQTDEASEADALEAAPASGNGALLRRARDLLLAHGEPMEASALAGDVFGVTAGVGAGPWMTLLDGMLRSSPVFARFDSTSEANTASNSAAGQRWGLAIWRQERRALATAEFVVVDVETTGLAPGYHRITEVAAVVVASGEQGAIFKSLVNPQRRIPQFITKFTGISERMVARAPFAVDILPKLSAFIGDRPIVGHNISFDLGFLSYEAERAGLGTLFPVEGIDTITLARRYIPGLRRASLDRVAATLHIPVRNRHRALADAQLTASIFALLLARAREAGCETLADLQRMSHGASRSRARVASGMFSPLVGVLPNDNPPDTADVEALADADDDVSDQPAQLSGKRRASGAPRERPTGALYLNPAWRKDFPTTPGVYLMKDADGEVIYVGKAKCLRERLASYYNQPLGYTRKMDGLLQNVREIETRMLGSELEALIVESRLIKQLQPRYNVQLRNHEQYPFIKVDLKSAYPRFYATREVSADGARYFGPFRSGGIVHATIELLYKVFPLRNCTRSLPPNGPTSEPCLRYHLKRCPAPCRGALADDELRAYHATVQEACAFLGGERADLLDRLKGEM